MAQTLAKDLLYLYDLTRGDKRLHRARHWARRKRWSRRPDLGDEGNGGSPVNFTARWWVEKGERFTAELWVKFGGLRRSEERARARRSELAAVSSLRALFWRERERMARVDVSTASGASPWTSCARWELTIGAIAGVRTTSGGQVSIGTSTPASSALNRTSRSPTDRATSSTISSQTRAS